MASPSRKLYSLRRSDQNRRARGSRVILRLGEVDSDDLELVGGKGAALGELIKIGMNVPPGFVVTTAAFRDFVRSNRLDREFARMLNGVDVDEPRQLARAAEQMQAAVSGASMSEALEHAIRQAYGELGEVPVAVRSSATAEDSEEASFAGQQSTFLGVRGAANVIRAVRECWASLYEARAIYYRTTMGFSVQDADMAVPVHRTVPSDVSGVIFTADPATGATDAILIEAIFGLGELLVSGELSPDSYLVSKKEITVRTRSVVLQERMLKMKPGVGLEGGTVSVPVDENLQTRQKVSDEDLIRLARMATEIENHYGRPQDIEWAIAGGEVYILQARPITTLGSSLKAKPSLNGHSPERPVIQGQPASPGVAAGRPFVVKGKEDLLRFPKGCVLVTEMTTPDYVPAMKRAAAIVTERGGRTCHAAIVSREMGIPCVVGAGSATSIATRFDLLTVDGGSGKVFEGDVASQHAPETSEVTDTKRIATRTRLYVNLADPDAAGRTSELDVDGVGLLRAEFMIAHSVGEHPRAMFEAGRGEEFTARLADGIGKFTASFAPRPVVYRFSDFKSNEYRGLKGGEAFEAVEENPMIGYRGCSRYLVEPELFSLEAQAVRRVRNEYSNLWVMFPFVRRVQDLKQALKLLADNGLEGSDDFKIWMMAELCSNVLLLDEFLDTGVDGVSIGSNDLTQLILGLDRDSEKCADIFDERDPAVMKAIELIVRGCAARGVTVSICGQAPSTYPDLIRQLVSWGITSISVTPDAVPQARAAIAAAESEMDAADKAA